MELTLFNFFSHHRFKIDGNYVGEPPSIEVTIFQLNDNIDKQFLKDMVQKFGTIEELFIYYHPVSNKHLGIGRVVFENVKSAKACVDKLNNTSVMGKILQVFLDPFGEQCKKKFEDFTTEKKPPPAPVPVEVPKVEPEPPKVEEKVPKERDYEDRHYKDREKELKESSDEYDARLKKDRDRDRERLDRERLDRDRDRYSRSFSTARTEFASSSSSDLGYGTTPSDYSASFGSTTATPLA